MKHRRRTTAATWIAAAVLLVTAGCGGGESIDPAGDPEIAESLLSICDRNPVFRLW